MIIKRTKIFLSAFFLLALLLPVVMANAQTGPPWRDADREAPDRRPAILRQDTLAASQAQTVIQLPAVADAYIASERPSQNFGSDSLFLGYNLVGSDNFGAERILLRFDVENNLPANAVIDSATLRLRQNFSSPANDDPMGTVLRRLASAWNENTVTWNTEPTWAPINDVTNVGSANAWYEWQVTDLVQDWHNGVYPNNGVEIIGDERVQQRERAFYARETQTAFFPQLVVTFTTVDDNQPPEVTVDPLPTYSKRSFTVSWTGTDSGGAGIAYTDVQVRVDGGPWQTWLAATTASEAEYSEGENGRTYEFRARGVDRVGNVEPFGAAEAETTVDTQPPTTVVDPLPGLIDTSSFTVSWTATQSVSGIAAYDVQYRVDNGPWQLWLDNTTGTSAVFNAPGDGVYHFEARAADNAGLVEPFHNAAEAGVAVDTAAPFVTPRLWLPAAIRN